MKKAIFLCAAIFMLIAISSCAPKTSSDEPTTTAPSTSGESTAAAATTSPAGGEDLGQNIYYYELYELTGDSGDGLTPKQGAELAATDIIAGSGILDSIPEGGCVYISFDEMKELDSADGHECYIYSVATGTIADGFKGGNYEVQYRVSVDYGSKTAAMYDDFRGGNDDDTTTSKPDAGTSAKTAATDEPSIPKSNTTADPGPGDPGDANNEPEWWGTYSNGEFSITINNFSGDSFRFVVSNLRNGEDIYDGVAAIDPDDERLATYENIGFYLYPDNSNIDFQASESSEWEHLRGQYNQI